SNLVDQYRAAQSQAAERASTDRSEQDALSRQYSNARNAAYASMALPIGLGAVTAGALVWYFAGTKERVVVVPALGGASVSGRFTLLDAVLAQVRAHVVPFHAALARHLAHVALGRAREAREVLALERRDCRALCLAESRRRLPAAAVRNRDLVAGEREHVVD